MLNIYIIVIVVLLYDTTFENYVYFLYEKAIEKYLDYNKKACGTDDTDEDDDLRRALQLSLECATAPSTPESEDLHWHQLNHFGTYSRTSNGETSQKLNI